MAAPRHSLTRHTGPLIADPAKLAAEEAKNALLQFDEVIRLIPQRIGNLQLSSDDVLELQRQAIQGIFPNAGQFRQIPIYIQNTSHNPPDWPEVPKLVSEMCDYANTHQTDAVHVASYLMWRLNWIHPFNDGNGRTSRAVSYLALCAGLGMELPGTVTVPELIVRDRDPYYARARQSGRSVETRDR